ncbi:hypothetical protein FWJ25_02855 [Marinobacter salinexigens]|uniref:Uncharacterized protein n=1 Tax=Marinobacter salinexigens TaxID=2919747 RepID=A0A5B0VP38_9GAMM|nr:hypothetical protein [Marinobacter salinexigens]KAA1176088.1 hypothetical protein FWJ25_02855 [Marinobacter salinexigens]
MKFLIILLFVAIVGFVAWRSKQNANPVELACARDIGQLLKSSPDADPRSIADMFVKHGIARARCPQVGRMVMPQLRKHGLKPEDAKIAMIQVKAAYALVP